MSSFNISFQDPFQQQEQQWTAVPAVAVTDRFLNTNWLQLNNDIYTRQDEVINDFYFYEVRCADMVTGKEFCLNLGGEYTYGHELEREGPLFTLRYFYPEEVVVRRFFGLGPSVNDVKLREMTCEGCDLNFAADCLRAFTRKDFEYITTQLKAHPNWQRVRK